MYSKVVDLPGGDDDEAENVDFDGLLCDSDHDLIEELVWEEELVDSSGPLMEQVPDADFSLGSPEESVPKKDQAQCDNNYIFDML